MQEHKSKLIILIIILTIAAAVAFFWPRPCTPDVDCVDYDELWQDYDTTPQ